MGVQALRVRDVILGSGIPKICVPIIEKSEQDILAAAQKICEYNPDCIEWRLDGFEDIDSIDQVLNVLRQLREKIGNTVLLTTFRTKKEGGESDISVSDYKHLYQMLCKSTFVDMIDIEAFMEEGLLREMCNFAHDNNVYVVASNHDFLSTPGEPELVKRLMAMDAEGADLPKLAVMPQNKRDVISLLLATLQYHEKGGIKPVITMSMAGMGMISRMAGEIFESAITFAAVGKASAPGQLPIEELRNILKVIHEHYE